MTEWSYGQCWLWAAGVFGVVLSVTALATVDLESGLIAASAIVGFIGVVAGTFALFPRLAPFAAVLLGLPKSAPYLVGAVLLCTAGWAYAEVWRKAPGRASSDRILVDEEQPPARRRPYRFIATCVSYYAGNPASNDERYKPACFEVHVIFANGFQKLMYAMDTPATNSPENLRSLTLGETRTVY